jgi:uridine kinase
MLEFDDVLALLRGQPNLRLIAIDGLPVSGKSTLADRIERDLGASILYLDDFVRPEIEWRGSATPAFPFPYMRYAEFLSAVMTLARGEPARFRRYDWSTGQLADEQYEIRPGRPTLVEGVSALHTQLAPLYDLRLWVESDAATTLEASLARGAAGWEQDWRELFLPSVALYMATEPAQRADYRVRGRGAPTS